MIKNGFKGWECGSVVKFPGLNSQFKKKLKDKNKYNEHVEKCTYPIR